MHAGNVFSALVSWIIARRSGGRILLRIEDLDAHRSHTEFAEGIMSDLDLLGLDWDGGPLYQSDREGAYREAYEKLEDAGLAYPCYCTRADVRAASAPHEGEAFIYPGTCRTASPEERERKRSSAAEQGRKPSHRVIVPHESISFDDLLQGSFSLDLPSECGDFVIRRSDGSFAYQLAVVIDDAFQGVTCVVRGCDLIASTPQQIFLQRALGLPTPRYAHVPLIMGQDGHRLSKRHADANLDALLAAYGTPEAILGHIAHVAGLIPEDAPSSAQSLLRQANLDALKGVRCIPWRA
jgi:glutamyl-queuosine tRNA(Asp) synthetase